MEDQPTVEEVKDFLAQHDFEYQRVNLPHGLYTPGDDRSATRDIIFPAKLDGASVLDIGSANGFFCFEAEKRGAGKVVGIELKDKRFNHALALKKLLNSNVEFRQQDIIEDPLTETFDVVIFLNVIHHLTEPMHALRKLASITNKKLVVEFPTLIDNKFIRTLPFAPTFLMKTLNRLPLIGVSSMQDGDVDQTFVFSPSSLRRALIDHDPLFRKARQSQSPMSSGRQILIFEKG